MENKTAVEWLMSKLALRDNCPFQAIAFYQDNKEFVEQAKEMEKQQIKDAFHRGENTITMTPEEYYNETYSK